MSIYRQWQALGAIVVSLFILMMPATVSAQNTVSVTATAKVNYSRFSNDTKDEALQQAKLVALKKYTVKFPAAKKRTISSMESSFYNAVDTFVVEAKIQQDKKSKSDKEYSVAIVALIDPGAIDAYIADNSAAGNQAVGMLATLGQCLSLASNQAEKSTRRRRQPLPKLMIAPYLKRIAHQTRHHPSILAALNR